jgi:hypothetical protein
MTTKIKHTQTNSAILEDLQRAMRPSNPAMRADEAIQIPSMRAVRHYSDDELQRRQNALVTIQNLMLQLQQAIAVYNGQEALAQMEGRDPNVPAFSQARG